MSKRVLVATYQCEEDILSGARVARAEGITILDAYTPYAVHGLDEAMGLKASRLTWVCFAFGASAAIFMTWFQLWTSAISWPINIGGKPWNSLPAYAPVIFEAMVLCAGLGTVAVLFLVCRLRPGKKTKLVVDGITNDRFALVVVHDSAERGVEETRQLFEASGPLALEERVIDEEPSWWQVGVRRSDDGEVAERGWLGTINMVLLSVLVVLVGVNLFVPLSPNETNWEIFREMMRSPAPGALSRSKVLPGGITFQEPVANTVARGLPPLHYDASEESAAAAGRELENPYRANEEGVLEPGPLQRGQKIFTVYCVACHGPRGGGDGLVTKRGFPSPPSFGAGKLNTLADGQLFHILTYGRGNMPPHAGQVPREDRWKAILYVRQLQEKAVAQAEAAAKKAEAEADAKDKTGEDKTAGAAGEEKP
ncbi:MAG: quinol:electron acceptor oxidoreductase subunit ActD [Pirellulaceae bacterium]